MMAEQPIKPPTDVVEQPDSLPAAPEALPTPALLPDGSTSSIEPVSDGQSASSAERVRGRRRLQDLDDEVASNIAQMWAAQTARTAAVKKTRAELKEFSKRLGQELVRY